MRDLLAAVALLLAVEGLIFAAFPDAAKRAMRDTAETPADRLRIVGIVSAVCGVALLWAVRRFLA